MKGCLHHRVYAPFSSWTAVWILLRPTVNEAYGFSSSSKNTRMSNHLYMSHQMKHVLHNFKTPSVGSAVVWTRDLPLGRPALIQLN